MLFIVVVFCCPRTLLNITMLFLKTYCLERLTLKPFVFTGSFLEVKAFDTYGSSSAGNNLRDYLNGINEE